MQLVVNVGRAVGSEGERLLVSASVLVVLGCGDDGTVDEPIDAAPEPSLIEQLRGSAWLGAGRTLEFRDDGLLFSGTSLSGLLRPNNVLRYEFVDDVMTVNRGFSCPTRSE